MILKRGSKGDAVAELQQALTLLGYALDDDGIFGGGTEKAVIAFQEANGLVGDGKVGKDTESMLKVKLAGLNKEPEHPVNQPWLDLAKSFIGMKEVVGKEHNPEIVQFWKDIKRGGIKDDETPWCAAFVGAMLERSNIKSSRFESAKSYQSWGNTSEPVYGCIAVFNRSGGGHVGFVVGQDDKGNLLVLGGNQGNAVNVKAFGRERVVAYRYPPNYQRPTTLPVSKPIEFSDNEA